MVAWIREQSSMERKWKKQQRKKIKWGEPHMEGDFLPSATIIIMDGGRRAAAAPHGRTRSFASVFVPATPGDIGTRAILESAGFSNSLFEKSKTVSSSNAAKRGKLENVGYKREKKNINNITSKSSGTKEADQKANQELGECRQGAEQ
uniref:Uncharacterized protein n=1 Tax=Oryza rufipogon TaxID=4529 RepID=A0A0E0QYI7_ORYRU